MVRSAFIFAMAAAVLLAACSPVYMTHAPGAMPPASEVPRARGSESASPLRADAPPVDDRLASVLGKLVWPLAVDRSAVLSSPYGVRAHPAARAARFHSGLDLRAPSGTPVHAAADGLVVHSGTSGAYGNVVLIDHGSELQSLYGHNQENLVREGDRVRRGQIIALVGRTGNATGDHLHFELRWRGGTVDPSVVLPRLGAGLARR
jgi:murein DD-endopeptidase MepM/ murein hydrolase activator NlpD